jgi:hypothetical protein
LQNKHEPATLCCLRGGRAIVINLFENGKARAGQQEWFTISSFCRL